MFSLLMYSVDYNIKKGSTYLNFESLFPRAITPDDLHLAINNVRNFSYLRRMFPQGQNYAYLCSQPAIN